MNAEKTVHEQILWSVLAGFCQHIREYAESGGFLLPEETLSKARFFAAVPEVSVLNMGVEARRCCGKNSTKEFDCSQSSWIMTSDEWNVAIDLDAQFSKGWHRQDRLEHANAYQAQVSAFIAHNTALGLSLGDVVWMESKGQPGDWFCGKLVYIHPSLHTLAVELPVSDGQQRPRVFFFGEHDGLFELHRQKPV